MERRRLLRVAIAGLAATALTLAAALGLLLAGGEANAADSAAPAEVKAWTLASASPNATGGVLCHEGAPCAFDTLREAADGGHVCAWTGTIALSGHDVPGVLRSVEGLEGFAMVIRGLGEWKDETTRNFSLYKSSFPSPWENGWWWSAEEERVRVSLPAPCDATHVTVALNYRGAHLLGGERPVSEEASVLLLEPSEAPDWLQRG